MSQRQLQEREVHFCAFCIVHHSAGFTLGRFTIRSLCECKIPGCPHQTLPEKRKR